MNKKRLVEIIEEICPSETAESWDNCGCQIDIGRPDKEIRKVLVSLEVTDAVIDEAVTIGADFILTHHPLIFGAIKNVKESDVTGRYLIRLISAGISVYSCHTSFDKLDGGNNDYLGLRLDLENVRPFDRDNGFCRKGEAPFSVTFAEVIRMAEDALAMEQKEFRWVGDLTKSIETIGWCTGAGSEFLRDAAEDGCDLYITGDVKYHEAQMAKEMGLCVLDIGHYGSEKIFAENMADMLYGRCAREDIEFVQSEQNLNPFY